MSIEQLRQELMALSLTERVEMAQTLWQNIHESTSPHVIAEEEVTLEARRRDGELTSGGVSGRSHEQVMEAARQAVKCI